MLLSLSQLLLSWYPEQLGFLRVFQYLTFRAVLAAMTSLLIGLAFGPWVIRRLVAMKIGQPIREYGMQAHLGKRGTPTMGGVLVLIGIGISTILWFDWTNRFVWVVMLVTFGFGTIGWIDDWRKVVRKDPEGMRWREKLLWQSLIGLVAAIYLAFSVAETTNVRVLEGALTRLYAFASLVGREITLELAQDCLADILRSTDRKVTIDDIQRKVSEHYNIRLADLIGPKRLRNYARPRQVAMFLAKTMTNRSLPEIGRRFGGRDHTTVMHGVRRITELRATDAQIADDLELLRRSLEG